MNDATETGDFPAARAILCVRLDSLGDVLMTEPALRALHESIPYCSLTLLTSRAGAQAAAMIPYLHDIIVYEAPWLKSRTGGPDLAGDYALIERLRDKRFETAVIFTVYTQNPLPSAMLCYLAGIPNRVAYCRENPYQLLTHWLPEQEPLNLKRHEVERQLALVSTLGAVPTDDAMRIALPASALQQAEALWQSLMPQGEYRLIVHPGASAISRRYPADRFVATMKQIQIQRPVIFAVTGDPSEKPLVDEISALVGATAHSFAGKLDTMMWAAMIATADLVLSNNTGAVHLAAATGTPVVDLYALTNPQHTPWRVPARVLSHDVPCRNCYKSICPEKHHRCLLEIGANEVAAAVLLLIEAALPGKTSKHPPCCID